MTPAPRLRRLTPILLAGLAALTLLSGCARLRRLGGRGAAAPPATATTTPTAVPAMTEPTTEPVVEPTAAAPTAAPIAPTTAPTAEQSPVAPTEVMPPPPATPPPLDSMTFDEKNQLFLELLSYRQEQGIDTAYVEELYIQSLEAAFTGDAAAADDYLDQAILALIGQ